MCTHIVSVLSLPPTAIPGLSVITDHPAKLLVQHSSSPVTIYSHTAVHICSYFPFTLSLPLLPSLGPHLCSPSLHLYSCPVITLISSLSQLSVFFIPQLINTCYWKEWCWSWNSSTLATTCEELPHWKRLWCWEGLGAGGEEDDRGWDGWMASLTRWTWVWVNSRSWWWTGRPGMLRFMGSRRVRHDWVTELKWTNESYSVMSDSLQPRGQ